MWVTKMQLNANEAECLKHLSLPMKVFDAKYSQPFMVSEIIVGHAWTTKSLNSRVGSCWVGHDVLATGRNTSYLSSTL